MEETGLAARARQLLSQSKKRRIVIAVGGIPGSGKSTVCKTVVNILNQDSPDFAVVVGMDGFHLPRRTLDRMQNPEFVHARRGAPFTFDGDAAVAFVGLLQSDKEALQTISAPSFDHALKDPVPDGIRIPVQTSIVFVEGLYVLMDQEPWSRISSLVDESWLISADRSIACERVANRHLESGIEPDIASAYKRADFNDVPNGEMIMRRLGRHDVIFDNSNSSIS